MLSDHRGDRFNSLKQPSKSSEAKISVMVNFKCQFSKAQYPDIWPNVILNIL